MKDFEKTIYPKNTAILENIAKLFGEYWDLKDLAIQSMLLRKVS